MGARFSAPVQTGPGTHPASCTMGTGSFPGGKSGRSVTLTPHPLLCRGQDKVELYLFSPCGPYGPYRASVPVRGCTLTLPYFYESVKHVRISYWYKIQLQKVFQTYSQRSAKFVKKKNALIAKVSSAHKNSLSSSNGTSFTVMQINSKYIFSQIIDVLTFQASLLPPTSR